DVYKRQAMRHEIPDRVPVFCQLALGHYFLHSGLRPEEIWFTSEGFATALVTLQQRYRFDGILINIPGRPAELLKKVRRIERTSDHTRLIWDTGETTVVPSDDNPHHYTSSGDPLPRAVFSETDPDHLEQITRVSGYVWNVYHVPPFEGVVPEQLGSTMPTCFTRTIELVRRMTHGEVSVHGEVFSPFTHFMELFGYQAALEALATDADKASAILDRLTQPVIAWANLQARLGVDAILISSAFAGGGFISRKMYQRFVLPFERKVIMALRDHGIPVYTHTCGRLGDRLDLLAETGTDGVDTLDPPPLGNVELIDAKKQIGDRLFIKGNLNSVKLLSLSEPCEVEEMVFGCLRAGAPGGGYVLSTACSVAPRVEPWKLEMLVQLAETYGRYG
ncbi:MAG: uroporphyrinogen decarboxylase family protein, partial [Verrucomicrobiae bacterium]|nr:uroporphyrinogen decarboxylase family protein [Verrucomicrobiae bacterium]